MDKILTPQQSPRTSVYLVRCGDYFKVGITSHMESRMNTLSCGNPFPIELLTHKKIRNARIFEQSMHDQLKKLEYHHKREWFKVDDTILDRVKNTIDLYE